MNTLHWQEHPSITKDRERLQQMMDNHAHIIGFTENEWSFLMEWLEVYDHPLSSQGEIEQSDERIADLIRSKVKC